MEYQVGCLAEMISEASGKKIPKSCNETVTPKVKFEKLEARKAVIAKQEQHKSPNKRLRFSDPLISGSDINNSISADNCEGEKHKVRRQKVRVVNIEEDRRTIFIGNVPTSCKKEHLKHVFASCGHIESIRFRSVSVANPVMSKKVAVIKKELHPQRSNMNAYIKFKEVESAHKALHKNGIVLSNHTLRVDLATGQQSCNSKTCVFVGNIKFLTEEEDLRNAFKTCGEIVNVRVVRDKVTGMGKGIAFVEFKNSASVELALKLDGEQLMGRCIRVSRLKEKIKGSRTGKKKNRYREGREPEKGKVNRTQQALKRDFNGIACRNIGQQNKSINKKTAGNESNAIREHGTQKKNKSQSATHFQGEKTGSKKIKKKKKTNKSELKKNVMLSKLGIAPKPSKKNKHAKQI